MTAREVKPGLAVATIEVPKNTRKLAIVHAPITTMSLYPVTYSHSSAGVLVESSSEVSFPRSRFPLSASELWRF